MAARDLGSHKSDWAQPSKTSLVALTLTEHDWKNKNIPKRSGDKRRSYMGCDGVLSNCGLAPIWKLLIARQALQPSWQHLTRWSVCWTVITGWIRPDCGGVPRPNQQDALQFCSELGKRLAETTGDVRASSVVFQRISVVMQRLIQFCCMMVFIDDNRLE